MSRLSYIEQFTPSVDKFYKLIYDGNMIIAGGALHKQHEELIDVDGTTFRIKPITRNPSSDIDIFTFNITQEMNKYLIDHGFIEKKIDESHYHEIFPSINKGNFYVTTGIKSVLNFIPNNPDRNAMLQFIVLNGPKHTKQAVLDFIDNDFDLEFCKLAYDGKTFYNEDKLKAEYEVNIDKIIVRKEKINPHLSTKNLIAKLTSRIDKYRRRGFKITTTTFTLPFRRVIEFYSILSTLDICSDVAKIILSYDSYSEDLVF